MADKASLKAIVRGHVQGVFFRAFVVQHAQALGLTGYACNLPGGEVEVVAEGDRVGLEALLERLKLGPTRARVEGVTTEWGEYGGRFNEFGIRR